MRRHALDLLLCVIILVGGVLAWKAGEHEMRKRAEYEQLHEIAGDLPIIDPTKVHVLALATHEPLHFAWRVYLPANYSLQVSTSLGGTSGSSSSTPKEFIARVRVRERSDGHLELFEKFSGGSSRGGLGNLILSRMLKGRWDKILVEQAGSAGLVILEPDASVDLLTLKLPEDLMDEARKALPGDPILRDLPSLFRLRLGSNGF